MNNTYTFYDKDYFTCHRGTLAKNEEPGVNVCVYAKGYPIFQIEK